MTNSRARVCLAVLLALLAMRQWIMPLPSSLWLDETGTFRVIKDGAGHIFERCIGWPGQSCLYSWIAWVACALGGPSEIALRLPSLLATVGATWLLFRLGTRLIDVEGGVLAALAFNLLPAVRSGSVDARPYALALLALMGATLALLRWVDEGSPLLGAVFSLLLSLTLYLHLLFGLAFVAHAAYIVRRLGPGSRVGWRQAAGWLGLAVALSAPLLMRIVTLMPTAASLAWEPLPPPTFLHEALVPPVLASGLALGIVVSWVSGNLVPDGNLMSPLAVDPAAGRAVPIPVRFDGHLATLGFEPVTERRFEGVEVLVYRERCGWIMWERPGT